ncbi:MAG: branched-chain amino acid ABC transporter permease, partial [Candidatus Methylomirabilia bacterium]
DTRLLTIIIFDGLNYAATLFLISVGLTLVYGVLRILNISHGGIYAFGAYLATWLALWLLDVGLPPYLSYLMLLAGAIIIGLVSGPIIERLLLRRIYGSDMHIQLLLTFSILLILDDSMKLIWGMEPMFVSEPYTILGQFSVAGIIYSWYHFLLIGVSAVFGGSLVWLVRGTRFGKLVVSVINDREVSLAMGINVNLIYTVAFTLGALAAALGGAFIAPTIAVVPGFALEVVVLSFAVIAIGGMGSLEGAALGALIVGLSRALAIHLFAELELVVIYLLMVVVLAIRPQGLFGEVELRRI